MPPKRKKNKHKSHRVNILYYLGIFLVVFTLCFAVLSYNNSPKKVPEVNQKDSKYIAARIDELCKSPNIEKQNNCYGDSFYDIAKKEGPDRAVAVLLSLQKKDQDISSCHFIAHRIGRGSFEYDQLRWREVFARTPPICASGIHHGFIDSYLSGLPESEYTKDETVLDVCSSNAPEGCFHGMGHVIYVNHEGDIERSIKQCNAFPENADKSKCYRGVFMEHTTPISLVEHGFAPRSILNHKKRAPELITLCAGFVSSPNVSAQCWAEISVAVLEFSGNDINKTLEICKSISDSGAALLCRSRSLFLMANRKPQDIHILKSFCDNKFIDDQRLREVCYGDIVRGAVGASSMDEYPVSINYCISLEERFRQSCLAHMIGAIKNGINKDSIVEICGMVPEKYQSSCLKF